MTQANSSKTELALAPLSGEVSDGRLDQLLAQGLRLDQAIYQLMWERQDPKFMREIFKPECFIPGADVRLPMVDIEAEPKRKRAAK